MRSMAALLETDPIQARLAEIYNKRVMENDGKPVGLKQFDPNSTCVDTSVIKGVDPSGTAATGRADETPAERPRPEVAKKSMPLPSAEDLVRLVESDPEEKVKAWVQYVLNRYHRHITLFPEAANVEAVVANLASTEMPASTSMKGEMGKNHTAVLYEGFKAGEANSRAHLRAVNFRDDHCSNFVKGTLRVFSGGTEYDQLPDSVLYLMADAKTHGNLDKLLKPFSDGSGSPLPKQRKPIYKFTSETSERDSKSKMRGIATMGTVEFVHLIANMETLSAIPTKNKKHSDGTNCSDAVGPFQRPKNVETWMVQAGKKSTLLGTALVACGGSVPGDAGAVADPGPKAGDWVPMTWHPWSTAPTKTNKN